MGKEKVIEKTTEEIGKQTNILLQYTPIIIGLICLIICYLLFKKIQSLNSQSDSVSKLEKQFTGFVKEQSDMNTVNGKKFNNVISQINQLGYIIQNSNKIEPQISPEKTIEKFATQQVLQAPQAPQVPQVPQVSPVPLAPLSSRVQQTHQTPREMMPTNIIQTSTPQINAESQINKLPPPMNTSIKKEIIIQDNIVKPSNKKVVDVQTVSEEVMIEEASSDDDENE